MTSMIATLVFAAVMATVTGNLFLGGGPTTMSNANQPVFNVGNIGQDPASTNLAGIGSVLNSLGGPQGGMSMDNPSLGGLGLEGRNTLSNGNNLGMGQRSWSGTQGYQPQQPQQQQQRNQFGRMGQQNPLLWWWMGHHLW